MIDPNKPVVKLCSEGMRAEVEGRAEDAHRLFLEAWMACQDDLDACVAARYVARHQEQPEEMLRWNQEALYRADAVGDERVRSFYPSLYLNLGWSYEVLGNRVEASRCYKLAAARIEDLPTGAYGDVVSKGIAAGQKRTGATRQ
jgi:tetratricopeptide (TPR) repeat protein